MEAENQLEKAFTSFNEGRIAEAGELFNLVLASAPGHLDALHGLSLVAWMRGDMESAVGLIAQVTARVPDSANYLNSMGEILRSHGDFAAAEEALSQALSINPDSARIHNNLGMLYQSQELFSKSIAEFRRSLELAPDLAMAYFNMGIALKETNRLDEAIAAYRNAIALQPDFVVAHVNLAIVLLLNGQMREGFEEYEWRLRPEFSPSRHFNRPRWDGMIDAHKVLLVHTEQGYGDAIQFIRYLPFIAAEGMRIIIQCPPELQNLMQSVEGVSMTYAFDEPLPDFDVYIPLLSLPLLFKTDLSSIPVNVPYVSAPFEKVQAWGGRLNAYGETVKIGLRWAGSPNNTSDDGRSVPLALFESLAGMREVTFVSLQDTPITEADGPIAEKLGLVDFSAELRDFVDTAALIENINLVISVDTAVMHLAGALGRPVWGLQKHAPHWPWMLDREDCSWYPSLRLFRQPRRGDWPEVLQRIDALLRSVMRSI